MESWLLLSNCQTFGLANSFSLLNGGLQVHPVDFWTYKNESERYNREMVNFDRVVIHPDIAALPEFDRSGARHLNYLPSINFNAYHPDFGYFWKDEVFIQSPMTSYNSTIAVAAYNEGLSVADARRLFNGKIYEACGFYRDWASQRDYLVGAYRDHGVDIAHQIRRWGRRRAFMYSVDHPRIEEVYDVAKAFVQALGMPVVETDVRPPDNLVNGPCLPIYNEVAEVLGVNGSYLFKKAADYRYIDLDEFLKGSFEVYGGYERHAIQPHPHYKDRYDQVLSVIRGHV